MKHAASRKRTVWAAATLAALPWACSSSPAPGPGAGSATSPSSAGGTSATVPSNGSASGAGMSGGDGGGAASATSTAGGSSGASSAASAGSSSAGPCTANITLKNVTFYGQGTATQPSVCSGVAPASAAVTGNVEAMVNGTEVYGNAPTAWFAYGVASTGQATPALTFDTAAASFSAAIPVTPAADGSYSFGAVGLAFLESAESPATCANGSGYEGVSFDIEGDFGSCKATFIVITSEDNPTSTNGTCTASTCFSPSVALTQTGTIMVPFTSLKGGMPQGTVDPSAITGLQWQFTP